MFLSYKSYTVHRPFNLACHFTGPPAFVRSPHFKWNGDGFQYWTCQADHLRENFDWYVLGCFSSLWPEKFSKISLSNFCLKFHKITMDGMVGLCRKRWPLTKVIPVRFPARAIMVWVELCVGSVLCHKGFPDHPVFNPWEKSNTFDLGCAPWS